MKFSTSPSRVTESTGSPVRVKVDEDHLRVVLDSLLLDFTNDCDVQDSGWGSSCFSEDPTSVP